jgi:hypothetical protein
MILKLCWAQVAERGVETTGVVDVIDKAWKIGGDVFESSGAPLSYEIPHQHSFFKSDARGGFSETESGGRASIQGRWPP